MKIKLRTPHITPRSIKDIFPKIKGKGSVLIRFGASKKSKQEPADITINTLEAIKTNADKIRMKEIFKENDIPSPDFAPNTSEGRQYFKDNKYNVVYKKRYHHGGIGMELVPLDQIDKFGDGQYNGGILERRLNVKREWRIHACPALNLTFSVEKRKRYDKLHEVVRNNDNCVFKVNFEIPENWNEALEMALKAVSVMNLDVGAVDLVWTGKNYYVIETNSGPGMGDQTSQWYADTLAELIEHKKNNQ
jgi:glutathione synthase/RimK-type ligase-like ATP-grasp enzyme